MNNNVYLTPNERNVLSYILDQVNDHIEWNPENDWYEDTGDILISLDRGQKRALASAMRKI
jgi:hypothetical protein